MQIDENTGLLEGNAEAALNAAESWKEAALQQALMEKYEGNMAAWAEAQIELADNQNEYNVAVQEGKEIESERSRLLSEQAKLEQEAINLQEDSSLSFDELNGKMQENEQALLSLTHRELENADEQRKLVKALGDSEEKMADADEGVQGYQEELDNLMGSQQKVTEETEKVTAAMQEEQDALPAWRMSGEFLLMRLPVL